MSLYKTKLDACQSWVDSFNAIPVSVAEKLLKVSGYNDFLEITENEDADDIFPAWSTMWTMDSKVDKDWCESEEGITALSECGFRVYESEDYGVVFGIDGAGYNFYEYHWLPLYEKRGLLWHV